MNVQSTPSSEQIRLFPLSGWTSRLVQWDVIQSPLEELAEEFGAVRAAPPAASAGPVPLTPADRRRVREAFERFRDEFQRVLGPLQKRNRRLMGLVVLAVVATFIGAVLAFFFPYGGVAIEIASLGSLVALLRTVWQLERDQAMLSVLPARYELAINLCNSRDDMRALLRLMLEESSSLQSR
jgi:hypothetical protein